ncbi:DUF397 domain-containing protein [Streptomyces sp. PSRA5]|uniref:DUF397 domain-containing protein n=1 Tax=Streptomyces panacea TaxID=3035064 RepID=UPI00339BB404
MNTEQVMAGPARLTWFKSSYSGSGGGNCVEVAVTATRIHIRDSKTTHGAVLDVPKGPWHTFIAFAGS